MSAKQHSFFLGGSPHYPKPFSNESAELTLKKKLFLEVDDECAVVNALRKVILTTLQLMNSLQNSNPSHLFVSIISKYISIYNFISFMEESDEARVNRILTTILMDSHRRIFAMVKQSPSTKKDLGYRTKYPSNLLDKLLKELSAYNLVKSIKRPQSKNMNVWVLYNHKEEADQQEQLQEKDDLMNLIRKKDEIAVSDLQKEAIRKGIKIDHFHQILAIMELSSEIFVVNGVLLKRKPKTVNSPCIQCKNRDVCAPGQIINPNNCPYLLSW